MLGPESSLFGGRQPLRCDLKTTGGEKRSDAPHFRDLRTRKATLISRPPVAATRRKRARKGFGFLKERAILSFAIHFGKSSETPEQNGRDKTSVVIRAARRSGDRRKGAHE